MAADLETNLNVWLQAIKYVGQFRKLFITGCPKSGTTWMQRCLNGHPQIVADGEGRFAWRLFFNIQEAIRNFNEDQDKTGGSPLGKPSPAEAALLMRSLSDNVFLRYLNRGGKPPGQVRVLADKTPQHVLEAKSLRTIYPTSRFINIIRDPRDAAASSLFHLAKTDTRTPEQFALAFICDSWRMHVEAAVEAEREMGPDVFLNIRYEDMHADETGVLRRCLRHIGVDPSDEAVRQCAQAGSFEKATGGRRRGQADNSSFFRNGTVGDWRNHLSPELAHRACRPIADLMCRFGYANEPAVDVSVFTQSASRVVAA
jgi:hypothetical protein